MLLRDIKFALANGSKIRMINWVKDNYIYSLNGNLFDDEGGKISKDYYDFHNTAEEWELYTNKH